MNASGAKIRWPQPLLVSRSKSAPAAPAVYRPLPVPKVLQTKVAQVVKPIPASRRVPIAPAPYRPQSASKVLLAKKVQIQLRAQGSQQHPLAPPVYKPQTKSVAQPKIAVQIARTPKAPPVYRPEQRRIVQRKIVTPAAGGGKALPRQKPVTPLDLLLRVQIPRLKPPMLRTMAPAAIQCTPLSGKQRHTFTTNLRQVWQGPIQNIVEVIDELEKQFGPANIDPLPFIRQFLGHDGSQPLITSKANYDRLKAHYGLMNLHTRLGGQNEAQLLRQVEIDEHWQITAVNLDWHLAHNYITFDFVEWWASQNYHNSHNCELRVRVDGSNWAFLHIHYDNRKQATTLQDIDHIHLKQTSLGPSLAAIADDGAAAQAAQAAQQEVNLNLATKINPAPWVV